MKTNTLANMLFVLGPFIALGVCLILTNSLLTKSIITGCYVLGLSMLIMAKWPLFQKNIWHDFGPGKLDSNNRKIYRPGYRILTIGVIINIIAFFTLQVWN